MSEDRRMDAPTDGKRLVLVEWVDSRGAHGNWVELEDLAQIGTCTMQSVGWVIAQDGDRIHVVPHVGTDPAQGCGDMVIPMCAVRSIADLTTKIGDTD